MFLSRWRRPGSDRFLPAKIVTLVVGGVLGVLGMGLDNALLLRVATGVVLVGFLLRFANRPGQKPEGTLTSDSSQVKGEGDKVSH